MLSRGSSIDCPSVWDVDNAALMVFTWHSINPFDFGSCQKDVMWSMYWSCKNFLNASEENGGPLSVVSLLGGPYWKISDLIFFAIGSAAFDEILYKN